MSIADNELPGYLRIHCDTPVGLVHVSHLARIHELAGLNDDAQRIRNSGKDWWRPDPSWIADVATAAETKMRGDKTE